MTTKPKGHSGEQQAAEPLMVAALAQRLGVPLIKPRPVPLPGGGHIDVDGVNDAEGVYVEAYAHQGKLKGGQPDKVASDALKLALLARLLPECRRPILLFASKEAASSFQGKGWTARALHEFGIEVQVVDLTPEVIAGLDKAQVRQAMVPAGEGFGWTPKLNAALAQIDKLAAEELKAASMVGMDGAVRHVLTKAVMAGVEFKTPADVSEWLHEHTGLATLMPREPTLFD